jgi:hypothetical protein
MVPLTGARIGRPKSERTLWGLSRDESPPVTHARGPVTIIDMDEVDGIALTE